MNRTDEGALESALPTSFFDTPRKCIVEQWALGNRSYQKSMNTISSFRLPLRALDNLWSNGFTHVHSSAVTPEICRDEEPKPEKRRRYLSHD